MLFAEKITNPYHSDEGARWIGKLLKTNTSITKLDLSNNGFTSYVAPHLTRCFPHFWLRFLQQSLGAKIITDSLAEDNFTVTSLIVQEVGFLKWCKCSRFCLDSFFVQDSAGKGDDLMSLNSLFDITEVTWMLMLLWNAINQLIYLYHSTQFLGRIQSACASNINFQKAIREKTGEARLNRRGNTRFKFCF